MDYADQINIIFKVIFYYKNEYLRSDLISKIAASHFIKTGYRLQSGALVVRDLV